MFEEKEKQAEQKRDEFESRRQHTKDLQQQHA